MKSKTRTIIESVLTGSLVAIFFAIASAIDSLPIWFLWILAAITWIILIIMIVVDAKKPPTLYINIDGQWVPIEAMSPQEIEEMEEKKYERF